MLENDKVILERDLLRAQRDQAQKLQEIRGNCDSTKSELEQLQRKQREIASGVKRKMKTSIEPLKTRSRPESKMELDGTPMSSGRFTSLACLLYACLCLLVRYMFGPYSPGANERGRGQVDATRNRPFPERS